MYIVSALWLVYLSVPFSTSPGFLAPSLTVLASRLLSMFGCLCGVFPFSRFCRKKPRSSSGASEGSQQGVRRLSQEVSCGSIDQTPTRTCCLRTGYLQTPYAGERTSKSGVVGGSATTLRVGQETLWKDNGVARGDTQPSYVDQEKPPMQEEVQKEVQSSKLAKRNSLTKKSEPEDATQRSDIKQEMSAKNSYDIQPADLEGLPIGEQHSVHERQPRKINEVPDDVGSPVLNQDTEKLPRKKDGVQPLDINVLRPPPMDAQDGDQLSEVVHHEEPQGNTQLSYVDQEKRAIREEVQKDVQSSHRSQRNSLTEKSEPEDATQHPGTKKEILAKNSCDTKPFNVDLEGLPIKGQHSVYERQPRKINEVPEDARLPVLTQDTVQLSEAIHQEEPQGDTRLPYVDQEKLPIREEDVQSSHLNQRNSLTEKSEPQDATRRPDIKQETLAENLYDTQLFDVDLEGLPIKERHSVHERQPRKIQLSEVIHHEEPETIIQSPDGKTPEVFGDVQSSNIVPESPPDVTHEQQPRKKIDKPEDDDQDEPPLVEAQDDIQTSGVVQEIGVAESIRPSDLHREGSLIDEHHYNGGPPDIMREREPRKKLNDEDHVQPVEVQDREPRKKNSKDQDEVQSPDVNHKPE